MAASKLVLALALRLASAALDWVSHPVAASDWVMLSGDLRAATGKGVTLTSRRDASNTTAGMGHVLVKGNTVPNGTEA